MVCQIYLLLSQAMPQTYLTEPEELIIFRRKWVRATWKTERRLEAICIKRDATAADTTWFMAQGVGAETREISCVSTVAI